tara:strand:+ start:59 stop:316 length:258 start_codon:yes stop_codon:yes gene_type:complete
MSFLFELERLKAESQVEDEKRKQALIDRASKTELERMKKSKEKRDQKIREIKQKIKEEKKLNMLHGGLANKKYVNPVSFVNNLKK